MTISRQDALEWIKSVANVLTENKDYLTELDSAIGDADHGANMFRGFQAVLAKLPGVTDKDIGTIFKTVGMTLVSTVGGASGPLYGTFFMQAGTASAGKQELNHLNVYSITGKLLQTLLLNKQPAYMPILLNTQNLANGLYVCEIITQSGKIVTGKLLISR
jgi:dihydroxyacetone kinase-like protein